MPYLLREGIQIEVLSAVTGARDKRLPHRQPLRRKTYFDNDVVPEAPFTTDGSAVAQ